MYFFALLGVVLGWCSGIVGIQTHWPSFFNKYARYGVYTIWSLAYGFFTLWMLR